MVCFGGDSHVVSDMVGFGDSHVVFYMVCFMWRFTCRYGVFWWRFTCSMIWCVLVEIHM